jgi:polar amino acid transport system substrate-binding protein
MRKRLISFFSIFSKAAFFTFCADSYCFANEVTIVADPWCPYTCSNSSDQPGVLIEIARKILEPAVYTVNYQLRPWSRAILETERGNFDAIAGVPKNNPKDLLYPQQMQALAQSCIYVRTGINWKFRALKDLEQIRLGIVANYQYDKVIRKYLSDNPQSKNISRIFGENDTLKRLYAMMTLNRIDAIVEEKNVFNYIARREGFDTSLYTENYCFEPGGIYIAFSPKNSDAEKLQLLMENGMLELKTSGELSKIFEKYSIEDTQLNIR